MRDVKVVGGRDVIIERFVGKDASKTNQGVCIFNCMHNSVAIISYRTPKKYSHSQRVSPYMRVELPRQLL